MTRLRRWPESSRRTLVDFKVFHVLEARRRSPRTDRESGFFIVDTWDWCNVVAFTDQRELVMVRQYRHGSEEFTVEIPGGCVSPNEDSAVAAARELREETGFESPVALEYIGTVNPNPALFTNRCDTFLALDCVKVGELEQDEGEDLEVVTMPLAEVEAAVRAGEIVHALVLAGLYHYRLRDVS